MEYETNIDRNNTLSIKDYLHEILLYLKGIVNNLKNQKT